MSDTSEIFDSLREMRREKKQQNLHMSTQILLHKGIEFEEKNYGFHLIVRHSGKVADFWPSTGKYQVRGEGSGHYRRGVFNLLRDLNVEGS